MRRVRRPRPTTVERGVLDLPPSTKHQPTNKLTNHSLSATQCCQGGGEEYTFEFEEILDEDDEPVTVTHTARWQAE